MIRRSIFASVALSALTLVACDNAADEQAKAEKAQATATDKITSATVEANQKVASAQAEADRKIAEAQASFTKLREDYRHGVTTDLADLDQKIAKLSAKDQVTSGQTRSDLDARLAQIRSNRGAFTTDFDALGNATAVTWDDSKARLDKEMSDLKTLVNRF
jgi:YD repeat-containing protein